VDSIWDSKIVPAAGLVRGEGKVVRVEAGALVINVNGGSSVTVLSGPVIRGAALRDALPFIQFSQFVNQLEFARVGNALNERAARVAQAAVGTGDVVGSPVRYSGAGVRKGEVLEVVPVTLEIVRGNQ
jgi:predicted lipoprotein